MDVPISEEQIRTLAFYLWEQDGGPEGRADEYWERARQQLVSNASDATSVDSGTSGLDGELTAPQPG
ncbi:DUF2934 domain-containing protein [Paraburkholderia bengalensis]|uniref:DUF2934 domain-containing protein n=2 Tax=Paraburkholderia bengalensis TaxID=2747562 RepID=A0ABU8J1X8_9BURK